MYPQMSRVATVLRSPSCDESDRSNVHESKFEDESDGNINDDPAGYIEKVRPDDMRDDLDGLTVEQLKPSPLGVHNNPIEVDE
jgi:hypothetical protein